MKFKILTARNPEQVQEEIERYKSVCPEDIRMLVARRKKQLSK